MRIKSFVLGWIILIFLFLGSGIVVTEPALLPISVDRSNYRIDDTVNLSINIAIADYSSYYLTISALNNSYTYKGDFNPVMFFYPTEEGIYTIALVEKSAGAIFYSLSFNVTIRAGAIIESQESVEGITSQENESRQEIDLPASEGEEMNNFEPANQTVFIATDKKEYVEGENVQVSVHFSDESQLNLYYVFNGASRRYVGDLRYINFVPEGIGIHGLVLKDNLGNILSSYQFEVKSSNLPVPKRIIKVLDSKGFGEDIEATVSEEANGFGSFDIIINKSFLREIKLKGLKITDNLSVGVEKVLEEKINIPQKNVVKSFAIDPTGLNFTNGTVTGVAVGTELWKCKEWNFSEQSCYGTWIKLIDIIPGREYSFILTSDDPGFTETSPTTGTADMGNVINLSFINYIDGAVADTQTDNGVFWAAGVVNPSSRRNNPVGYFNITYNISAIGLSSPSQIFDLNFTISYCHSGDVTAPTTCSALPSGTTLNPSNVQIFNYTSGAYVILGTLVLRDGVEGVNNYTLNYSNYNLSDFVSNNFINIRYGINISMSKNNDDAALAIDYAPLTLRFDKTNPQINFTLPTENSSLTLNRSYIIINVTANDTTLKNITIYLYNISGALINSSYTTSSSNLFANFSNLSDGVYYFNATAYDTRNNFNYTLTRNVTIITQLLNITSIMVDDGITFPIDQIDLQAGTTKSVYCNMTVVDSASYTRIQGVNATFYSFTTTYGAADDNRTHYTNGSCAFITGAGQSADYVCVFNVWHFAVNGTWNCTGFARGTYVTTNATNSTAVNQLFALNISTSVIDYSNLQANETSQNVTVNISNVGNMPMNISVYGFGGDDEAIGTGLSMICQINNISIAFERFSTDSTIDYNSKNQLSSTPQGLGLTILSKTIVDEIKTNSTYWQFLVPPQANASGQCNGSVVFMAESP